MHKVLMVNSDAEKSPIKSLNMTYRFPQWEHYHSITQEECFRDRLYCKHWREQQAGEGKVVAKQTVQSL